MTTSRFAQLILNTSSCGLNTMMRMPVYSVTCGLKKDVMILIVSFVVKGRKGHGIN